MANRRIEGSFPSATGLGDIYYRSWISGRSPKGAIQIVHGMAEHGERYEAFAHALNEAGYDVWAMDLPGHGKSGSEKTPGYFGEKNGRRKVLADLHKLSEIMRDNYPRQLPIFMFGHSMGSLFARAYCKRHNSAIDGAIFCGTSGPNPAAPAGVALAKLIISARGERYRSPLLDNIAFGSYNKRFAGRTKFDWLNSDDAEVDKYNDDPHCGFVFTVQGMMDLFALLKSVSAKSWFASMPYQFPVLLIAGAQDPVGNYGKGVEFVAKRLRQAGSNRVRCLVFPGMRHEILLESEHKQVYETVINWLDQTRA
jgi:alpha-beta hydrolase superfamily lysophospholipase